MANRLTMAEIDKILTLHTTAHTNREIADLLAINRETVGKHVARFKAQNRPNAPPGSEQVDGRLVSNAPPGPAVPDGLAMPTPASLFGASSSRGPCSGPSSECAPYREQILAKAEQGLSAKRISRSIGKAPPAITACGGS